MVEYHPIYDRLFIPVSGMVVNVSICFLMMYYIIKEDSIGYRILNASAVTFIGRLSYSLYIWQQLFLSRGDFWFAKFPLNVILMFLAAYISYMLIEKPFLRLKEKFR
jgi:peptidoglycan/LPS O-acetylase OafA/YrhL